MTEGEMLDRLEALIQEAEARGLDTGLAAEFFSHGEWLLAFGEIRFVPDMVGEQAFLAEQAESVAVLDTYFRQFAVGEASEV